MTKLDPKAFKADAPSRPVGLGAIDSAALARLVEEVRNADTALDTTAYNRTYHRHNR